MRPNATPAKESGTMTLGQRVERMSQELRADWKTKRRMITDLCDFCLKTVYMKRSQIGMRARGKKFMCEKCRFTDGRQEEAKANKYLPCWQENGGWRAKVLRINKAQLKNKTV